MKPLLGLHISTSCKMTSDIQKLGTIQIFAGSPQTFNISETCVDFVNKYHKDFKIIIHSPYIINLVNDKHKIYSKTLSFTKQIAQTFGNKIYGYNTHLGLIYTKQQLKEGINESISYGKDSLLKTIDELLPIYENNKTILLLENSTGNEYGSDLSNVNNIVNIVKKYNSPYLKMTLDTNHSFGNGDFTIVDINEFKKIKDYIGCIHFNAIGGGEFGEHKDIHGGALMTECLHYKFEDYQNFYKQIIDIPTIMEIDYQLGLKQFDLFINE